MLAEAVPWQLPCQYFSVQQVPKQEQFAVCCEQVLWEPFAWGLVIPSSSLLVLGHVSPTPGWAGGALGQCWHQSCISCLLSVPCWKNCGSYLPFLPPLSSCLRLPPAHPVYVSSAETKSHIAPIAATCSHAMQEEPWPCLLFQLQSFTFLPSLP